MGYLAKFSVIIKDPYSGSFLMLFLIRAFIYPVLFGTFSSLFIMSASVVLFSSIFNFVVFVALYFVSAFFCASLLIITPFFARSAKIF
jgi:hypothetical protein